MTLGEFTKVFSNETYIVVKLLTRLGIGQLIYTGKIYRYSEYLNETHPNINYKEYNVISVNVVDGHLDIIIEQ